MTFINDDDFEINCKADRRLGKTADPAHLTDNLDTMRGQLPDATERMRMVELV